MKSLVGKRTMLLVGWGMAIGVLFGIGYFSDHGAIKIKYGLFMQERYVVMPERITDDWLKGCLSRVEGVNEVVLAPGSLRFFAHHGKVMGLLTYDRDEQILTFVTGINVKYNQYLYEIANYRNLACSFQRLCFDEEKEFLSLAMDLDVAAGVTAAQVELAGRIFARAMADFYTDFMSE
jgi:hypothetical protein